MFLHDPPSFNAPPHSSFLRVHLLFPEQFCPRQLLQTANSLMMAQRPLTSRLAKALHLERLCFSALFRQAGQPSQGLLGFLFFEFPLPPLPPVALAAAAVAVSVAPSSPSFPCFPRLFLFFLSLVS